ncbi:MAG: hypothetical protein U9P71_09015 [Campylobacterota bacterium]|nr:hypothetical protein [Campylobacterota bacterium]
MPRHNYFLAVLFLFITLLTGCGSKEYYVPESTVGDWDSSGTLSGKIIDVTSDGAVLDSGEIMTTKALIKASLTPQHRFLSFSDGWVVSSTSDGNVSLKAMEAPKAGIEFELKKTVAAASVKDDILAVLFANNEMAIYSLASKELLFKEQGTAPIAVDSRVQNPYFMQDLVLFLTLDGKIVIVNTEAKKVIRSMIVSSESYFNNITHFNVIGNTLIAATPYNIFSLGAKEVRESYELRDMVFKDDVIYICTKQGEIVSFTPSLQKIAAKKFQFAHFLGLIVTDNRVYALEKEGYLISLDKELLAFKVYDVDIEDGYVFTANKTFFVNDIFFKVK